MALFDFSPEVVAEQVARGTLLQPGWYTIEIATVEDDVTKKGDKITNLTCKVLDGLDMDGKSVTGVKLYANFMPDWPAFAIPFVNALGAKIGMEGKKGIKIDKDLVGRKLRAYVIRGEYKGKGTNEIADYRPLDA